MLFYFWTNILDKFETVQPTQKKIKQLGFFCFFKVGGTYM